MTRIRDTEEFRVNPRLLLQVGAVRATLFHAFGFLARTTLYNLCCNTERMHLHSRITESTRI